VAGWADLLVTNFGQITTNGTEGAYTMNKLFSFMAGAMCGVLVGGVTALLLTPTSGNDLREQAIERWETAKREAQQARSQTRQQLESEFEQMKSGSR
jgi:gas vesicle protein